MNPITAVTKTLLPANFALSLVLQQLSIGCGNPMCTNRYCISPGSMIPSDVTDLNGRINYDKVAKVISSCKDIDTLLCKPPLKAILARVQEHDKKFDPKLQMFEPRCLELGVPSFATLTEAQTPLTCPFSNDRLFEFFMIDLPTRSFASLNDFLAVGTVSVLDEFFCFTQWISLAKEKGVLHTLYNYLAALADRLALTPRLAQTILQEEAVATTPTLFLLHFVDQFDGLSVAPYNYSTGDRISSELITREVGSVQPSVGAKVTLLHSIERLIADSTDEFKIELIKAVDTLIPLLRTNYPLGETLSDTMNSPTLIPVYNMSGTLASPRESEMSKLSRDTSFKFVRRELDLSSLGSDSYLVYPQHLKNLLTSCVKRIGFLVKSVATSKPDDIPIRKIHLGESVQYTIENILKVMDMLWFVNLKYHFTETKSFIVPEINDNGMYNLIDDFDVFMAVARSVNDPTSSVVVRGGKLAFADMLDVPNFSTSPFSLRVRFRLSIAQCERCSSFSLLLHPFTLNAAVKARVLSTELRLNHTAEVPVIPQFIPGFALPITGIEYVRSVPITVSRHDLVHDTISALSKIPPKDLSRSQLKVTFNGEEGIDEGGVSTEYFNLIIAKLVNPRHGLFIHVGPNAPIDQGSEVKVDGNEQLSSGESEASVQQDEYEGEELVSGETKEKSSPLWFNKLSDLYNFKHSCVMSDGTLIPIPPYLIPDTRGQLKATHSTEELMYYTGMLFGLAVNNHVVMDVDVPKVFYRKLACVNMGGTNGTRLPKYMLNDSLFTLSDLSSINPQMAVSLSSLLDVASDRKTTDEDIDALELYQSVDSMYKGELVSVPLIPTQLTRYAPPSTISEAIPKVTRATASDFVDAYVKHECSDGIRSMFTPFRSGFKAVLGCTAFRLLAPSDIKHYLVGSHISGDTMKEVRQCCSYEGFGGRDKWILWFWDIVESWDIKKVKKLLKFITGSARIGVGGAKGLNLKIIANGDNDAMLPTSHVCFNILMLPKYSSHDVMEERLLTAINNSEGFGLR